ncbi:MAG: hypothetical protein U5O39_01610 [Gammaproteobacteria bacterium]|nr:hypothetical protein [Gammaproteobacteria bacterium]
MSASVRSGGQELGAHQIDYSCPECPADQSCQRAKNQTAESGFSQGSYAGRQGGQDHDGDRLSCRPGIVFDRLNGLNVQFRGTDHPLNELIHQHSPADFLPLCFVIGARLNSPSGVRSPP